MKKLVRILSMLVIWICCFVGASILTIIMLYGGSFSLGERTYKSVGLIELIVDITSESGNGAE